MSLVSPYFQHGCRHGFALLCARRYMCLKISNADMTSWFKFITIGMLLSSTSPLLRIAFCNDDLIDLVVSNWSASSISRQVAIRYKLIYWISIWVNNPGHSVLSLVRLRSGPAPSCYSCSLLLAVIILMIIFLLIIRTHTQKEHTLPLHTCPLKYFFLARLVD